MRLTSANTKLISRDFNFESRLLPQRKGLKNKQIYSLKFVLRSSLCTDTVERKNMYGQTKTYISSLVLLKRIIETSRWQIANSTIPLPWTFRHVTSNISSQNLQMRDMVCVEYEQIVLYVSYETKIHRFLFIRFKI